MNAMLPGEHDSTGDMAFNALLGPVALHSAMGIAKVRAEGLPKVSDFLLGKDVTADKVIERIARDTGNGQLSKGQLYDLVMGKQIDPQLLGEIKPPVEDAQALKDWRETAIVRDGRLVSDHGLEPTARSQLNYAASQLFSPGQNWDQVLSRLAQSIHQDLPKDLKTKQDFLAWAGEHDNANLAKYEKALRKVGQDEVIFRQGKFIDGLDKITAPDADGRVNMTKAEVIKWLNDSGRTEKANEIASWTLPSGQPFPDNTPLIKDGQVPKTLRPRVLGFGGGKRPQLVTADLVGDIPKAKALNLKEINGTLAVTTPGTREAAGQLVAGDLRTYLTERGINADQLIPGLDQAKDDQIVYDRTLTTKPAEAQLTVSNDQAAMVLGDVPPMQSGRLARVARQISTALPASRDFLVNTIGSGAGMRRIDILNDSAEQIANGLKWRGFAARQLAKGEFWRRSWHGSCSREIR